MYKEKAITLTQRLGCLLGNLLEHYDSALYGLLTPFIGPLFFPNHDPIVRLIITYSLIPLGMCARPIGALFFGQLGDRLGNGFAFYLSLLGMGLISLLIALTPTYAEIGFLAPLILIMSRLLQNFCAAGENASGAMYLIEKSPSDENISSSWYSSSTIAGILLASSVIALFCSLKIIETHWRLLYLFGSSTALLAIFLRRKLPSFNREKKTPLTLDLFFKNRKQLFYIALTAGFSYATFSVAFILTNGLTPFIANVSQDDMIYLNTVLLGLDLLMLPLFGLIANIVSPEKLMRVTSLMAAFLSLPLFYCLEHANFTLIILVRTLFVIIGVGFSATFYSWAKNFVSIPQKLTLISLGYALGTQIIGGPTALISLWLFAKTGIPLLAGSYWMLLAIVTYVALKYEKTTSRITYETV